MMSVKGFMAVLAFATGVSVAVALTGCSSSQDSGGTAGTESSSCTIAGKYTVTGTITQQGAECAALGLPNSTTDKIDISKQADGTYAIVDLDPNPAASFTETCTGTADGCVLTVTCSYVDKTTGNKKALGRSATWTFTTSGFSGSEQDVAELKTGGLCTFGVNDKGVPGS